MSGTSLDGVDAVLAQIDDGGTRLLGCKFLAYDDQLRDRILRLHESSMGDLETATLLELELSELYASCIKSLLGDAAVEPENVVAVGCHGQTIRHRPECGYTLQLVNGSVLAERTGMTVVCDFRSRDIAAGGQGAPLVPAFHAAVFRDTIAHRAIINIGGIANITDLAPGGGVRGFDCGPGNMLLDAWARKHLNRPYDNGGTWARTGKLNGRLLTRWLSHPYFALAPPKSAGREQFHDRWIAESLEGRELTQDVQRTLVELTAQSIADAIGRDCAGTSEVYLCGGGTHSEFLRERLTALLSGQKLATTSDLGFDPDWVEATAFAWLARQTIVGLPGNLPSVTGARGPRVLGAIHRA